MVAKRPNLLIIAGVSHEYKVKPIRELIWRARQKIPGLEVLVMTGAVTEPGMSGNLVRKGLWEVPTRDRRRHDKLIADFYRELQKAASEDKFELLHLRAIWESYIAASGKPRRWFMRDYVHANEYGKQVLGRIVERYFLPDQKISRILREILF